MQTCKKFVTLVFFLVFLSGCAAKVADKDEMFMEEAVEPQKLIEINKVSVTSFECEDPSVSQIMRIKIIESLLPGYGVVIGGKADVDIRGVITLSSNKWSTASYVSEVRADILKDGELLDSVSISQEQNDSVKPATMLEMAIRIGAEIRDKLSQLSTAQ
jgi:hypothetical protein